MTSEALASLEMRTYFAGLAGFLLGAVCWSVHLFGGRRNETLFRVGWAATCLGVVALLATFVARSLQPAHPRLALTTLFEITLLVQLGTAGALLIVLLKSRELRLAAPFVMAVVIGLWVYGRARHEPIQQELEAALRSTWLQIHVATAILSYGPLFMSGVTSIMAVCMFVAGGKWISPGPATEDGEATASTADRFEEWTYRVIAFGFPWLTALILTGAVWANYAWGRPWGWDPKEMWSAITWVIYVAYLHMRLRGGWRGRTASITAAIAWVAMLVTFVGVNWLTKLLHLDSLHAYG